MQKNCIVIIIRKKTTGVVQLQAIVDMSDYVVDYFVPRKQSVGDEWGRMIKEKDEQIAQLMEEGVTVPLCTHAYTSLHLHMHT